jgi:serine/threonine protein kinase
MGLINSSNYREYTIIEKINKGECGIVYKIIDSNKNIYALKIEKIIYDEMTNKKLKTWREINFYKNIAHVHPKYFIKYHNYYFEKYNISNSNLDINLDNFEEYESSLKEYIKEYIVEHNKSNLYIYKIFDLIDCTLDKIIYKLTKKQLYSMIIQLFNIIDILRRNNYIHGDLNLNNIGVIKTQNKYIIINGLEIPTYGYIYKLIDFQYVLNKNDIKNEYEKNKYNELYENEYINILNNFIKIKEPENKLKFYFFIENKKYNTTNLFFKYLERNMSIICKKDIYYIIDNIDNYDRILSYFYDKINNTYRKMYIVIIYIILISVFLLFLKIKIKSI